MNRNDQQGATLLRTVIDRLRDRRRTIKVADTTGAELTGTALLARSLILRRLLRRMLDPGERRVGILLPPTAAAVAANLALTLDRRSAVNLNYTLTSTLLNGCLARAGIRHVVTSRRFLEQVPLDLDAEPIFLEDLKDLPTRRDKAIGGLLGYAAPTGLLLRLLGLHRVGADEEMTVIFTAGTTGDPKGAVLTVGNIAASVDTVGRLIRLERRDVALGILPFFHSFGYVMTLWAVLANDVGAAYHVNPLDARTVGILCRKAKVTLLLATPMFLRSYLRRCKPSDLASVEAVMTGAEKLPRELGDAFEARFGLRPVEGYGTTELTALIAANAPPTRAFGDAANANREGTVGRPVPGVRVKVVDLETGAELGPGEQGMLWVSGPNVMKGYLGQPEATAAVVRDGWYVTGDVGIVHADGCVELVGRISRFAKIAGEMVPLVRIEETLTELAGPGDDGPSIAVTAIPDPARGERIVVVHGPLAQTPDELRRGLADAGMPNLFIPSTDSFVEVACLPVTGAGKLDLRGINQIALAAFAVRADRVAATAMR
jgi:acyl-[acyl-carrier-protein]-phospholipid O-acyltransferase/long-chain-fatty-acid--[acyl-carrier-protein] ligase